ncbi:unnamed protein product [Alopecurus aequalis]
MATAMVDGQFCAPHRTAFLMTKSHTEKGSEFVVTRSADGAVSMQVETAHIGYRNLRSLCLLDVASRRPLITVEEFKMGKMPRWEAFRGDGTGTSTSDRLFVALRMLGLSVIGLTVHVFLDGNSSGDRAPDFVVHGHFEAGNMTVSRGVGDGHDKDIAKIDRWNTPAAQNRPAGENVYAIWIKPDVDQAFVLALTVVLDQIHDGFKCACSCNHTCQRYKRIRRH